VRTRLVLPAAVIAAGLIIGACSSSDHDGMGDMNGDNTPMDNGSMGDMGTGGGQGSTTTLNIPAGADFNAIDVAFAQGMIPHHGQAVQMADLALQTSTNADVKALAEQIQAAQSPEIDQMTTWLTDWGQPVPDPNAMMDDNMDHSGGMMMSGMMSAADMARLGNATGTDFDKMFLEMMILHHEGAIEMAQQELAEGKNQATKDLAQAVITGQQAEIEEMNTLIASLPA
jgi:uncharacterized protein (DUF305 family)